MAGRVALQRRPARAVPQGQRALHNGADRVPFAGHALDSLHGPLVQRMGRPALRVHRHKAAYVAFHVAGDGQQTAFPRAQLRHALQRQALRLARQGIGPVHVRLIHRSLRRHGAQEQPAVLHHRRPVPPLRQVHRRARVVQRTDERAVLPSPELLPAQVQQGRCAPVRVDQRVKADSLRLQLVHGHQQLRFLLPRLPCAQAAAGGQVQRPVQRHAAMQRAHILLPQAQPSGQHARRKRGRRQQRHQQRHRQRQREPSGTAPLSPRTRQNARLKRRTVIHPGQALVHGPPNPFTVGFMHRPPLLPRSAAGGRKPAAAAWSRPFRSPSGRRPPPEASFPDSSTESPRRAPWQAGA